jgi:competence protein ComEA
MQHRLIPLALCAAVSVLGDGHALAADKPKATAMQPQASATHANPHMARIKPVDINSASLAELKTLPGIGDAEAARIIAARPYPSKAKLVADKVLSEAAYLALKGRIIAIQPEPPRGHADGKPGGKAAGRP